MSIINCVTSLILNSSPDCVNSEGNKVTTFAIIDTKLYLPVVT